MIYGIDGKPAHSVKEVRKSQEFIVEATKRAQNGRFSERRNTIFDNLPGKTSIEKLRKNTFMKYDENSLSNTVTYLGANMETTNEELKMVTESVVEAKKVLQELFNEITELQNQTSPMLAKQINDVRDSRMTLERETKIILTTLKDVRKFFLEQDYQTEVKRLTEFMELCRTLKKLKDDGTLDAISDTIIKLQIGGKP